MIGVRSRTVAAAVPSSWQVSLNVATTSPFSGSASSALPLNIARSPSFRPSCVWLIFDSIQPQPLVVQAFADLHVRHGTRIWRRSSGGWGGLLHRWRHGDPGRAEDRAAGALDLATQQEPLAVLLHFHHLQAVQILDHVSPLEVVPVPGQTSLQFLAQHQRQERAEHVAPDRLVALVVNRPSLQQRLARAEPGLHHPEPLELQCYPGRIQVGVGPEHPLAVVSSLLLYLGLVDLEVSRPCRTEVAAIALVAYQ